MTNKTTDALDRLTYAAYGISIRDGDEIDADVATIRAALDNPMTLPDFDYAAGLKSLRKIYNYVHINDALTDEDIDDVLYGDAFKVAFAALNALAKIKEN